MPLLIPCDELKAGMKLYESLIAHGRILLQGGRALTSSDITVLQRRYPGLSVRVGDPVLDEVLEFEDDARERAVATWTQQKISTSMSQVQTRFTRRASLEAADFDALSSAVDELMGFLKANPTSAALISNCLDSRGYLGAHTGNVFYLSMLLGSTVLDYVASERNRQTLARGLQVSFAEDLTPLGLGVMAMDLGMLPLQHLFDQDKPLSTAEREMIQEHPNVAAGMLPRNFSSLSRMIVRTHHENFDGSGYPAGMPGNKVHVFTRIVRIADAYDAATSERVYRQARSPVRVLWEMSRGPYRRFYDPRLMRSFSKLIQPFPIGSKLRLADGRYGAVVRYNRRDPFRPIVVIAFDEQNQPLPKQDLKESVDLADDAAPAIRSFHGEDLSFLYTETPDHEAPVAQKFESLLEAAYP
jgi:hypothetical protein